MATATTVGASGSELSRSWIRVGPVAGAVGVLCYVGAVVPMLPDRARMLAAFAFGPLLSIGFVGFYHFLKPHRNSPLLQIAVIFGVIAGTLVNLMLVVQQALFAGTTAEARRAMGAAWSGFNLVQLGIDVSWDVYIAVATVLLGLVLARHPRFGWGYAAPTTLIGLALLVLNLWSFPIPPDRAGLVGVGPLTGLVFLVLSIRGLASVGWWEQRYGDPDQGSTRG